MIYYFYSQYILITELLILVPLILICQLTPEAYKEAFLLRLMLRVAILAVVFSCFVGIASASGFYRSGDRGTDIESIQMRLKDLGFYKQAVDGIYGEGTVLAVQKFQQVRGIDVDGVVGVNTYKLLMGRDIPVSRAAVIAKIRKIIQESFQYLGVPYVFGGTSTNGFDCSGFTQFIFAEASVALPRMADAQYEVGYSVAVSQLQAGDLVFFETYEEGPSHCGIYIGGGKFISATSSRGIAIDQLSNSYWNERHLGARRIL